jgi:Transposase DDE domain
MAIRPPRAGLTAIRGHVAVDPDSELITATTVTAGNVGDAQAVEELLAEELADPADPADPAGGESTDARQPPADALADPAGSGLIDPAARPPAEAPADPADPADGESIDAAAQPPAEENQPSQTEQPLKVYGDSAYGAGSVLETLEHAEAEIMCKVQPPVAPGGRFAKDAFKIDHAASTVSCPAGQTVALRAVRNGQIARFGHACHGCPLAQRCTTSTDGRTIHLGPHEQQLTRARARQADPQWKADYTATRPKVERKISHLMRRKHGGRHARVRGKPKVNADFSLLAAAVNLARLATLGLTHHTTAWAASTA